VYCLMFVMDKHADQRLMQNNEHTIRKVHDSGRRCALHSCLMLFICVWWGRIASLFYVVEEVGIKRSVGNVVNSVVECLPTCAEGVS